MEDVRKLNLHLANVKKSTNVWIEKIYATTFLASAGQFHTFKCQVKRIQIIKAAAKFMESVWHSRVVHKK